ncbi:hypothetical protein ACHAWF_017927 [Thalassiosira exigua]
MPSQNAVVLPADCGQHIDFGILCHRNYAYRISEALIQASSDEKWSRLGAIGHHNDASLPRESNKCTIIPTPEEKGRRKDRIGYTLLVITGTTQSPARLPPMARKHISWAARLTHQVTLDDVIGCDGVEESCANESNNFHATIRSITRDIWSELTQFFDSENDFLRIDVHPKLFDTEFRACFNDEMGGKVRLACSASKVSHVVAVVIQTAATSCSTSSLVQNIYWGISKSNEYFLELNQRLNDHATGEVILDPTDPKTGLDKGTNVLWDAPVSRAYYKLAQVFDDINCIQMAASVHNSRTTLEICTESLSHGSGLDIGASPGGWTQVLHNTLGMSSVVAVDPGLLAQRVQLLRGVHHICAEISSEEAVAALAKHAPYSVIVCDASISNANELLVKMAETLEKASSMLRDNQNVIAWPLCLVVTLKLPYKTSESIDRNLKKVNSFIPEYLTRIALLDTCTKDSSTVEVDVKYRICHLFANSISERTLVAIFQAK